MMKVVTYNIRYGLDLDQHYGLEKIADTVRDADIIGLQEVERYWRRSGMIDQPERLSELLPDHYWVYFPAYDIDASIHDVEGKLINRRRQFGPMLLSRWPIASTRRILLPQLDTHKVFGMTTGAIEGVIDTPLGGMRVYSLHLSSASTRERLLQLDTLLGAHSRFSQHGAVCTGSADPLDSVEVENFTRMDWLNGESPPITPEHALLLGDFNSVEESTEYMKIVGEVDPIYGRGIHADDLVDSWQVTKHQLSDSKTWWPDPPDRAPGYPLRLDYCFASVSLCNRVSRAWVDTEARCSDHKPYWIEIE